MMRSPAAIRYLDLMQLCLTNTLYEGPEWVEVRPHGRLRTLIASAMNDRGIRLVREKPGAVEKRRLGQDNNPSAHTMIGIARLANIRQCVESVLEEGIPGDLIEAGVWRGGAAVFMRAILEAYGDPDRAVWVADSFRGLPPPNVEKYPQDEGDYHHEHTWLAVSRAEVEATFRAYGLLDGRVRFLEGWFKDTLPRAPIERLALIRLDGDMYESTMDSLTALYPRLSVGGYIILDDWGLIPNCRRAIDDFRKATGISEPILDVDGVAGYWRRQR